MNDPDEYPSRTRASRYEDVRDDYDDEFHVRRPLRWTAGQKVIGPAVAFVVIGVLGIVGMVVAILAAIVEFMTMRRPPPLAVQGLALFALLLATVLFVVVIAGGFSMVRLRRWGLAATASYIVAGLSLAGCYGILFYPFGIWALVVLYQPDVREQFRRPPGPGEALQ
ncbi:MAG TPA: hypothetical protein VM597_05615 [Gemmataceae bacterium]|nr:hypothetical protein [Gemmataceae bacterium]